MIKTKLISEKMFTFSSVLLVSLNELMIFVKRDVTTTISTVLFNVTLLSTRVRFFATSPTFLEVIFTYKIKHSSKQNSLLQRYVFMLSLLNEILGLSLHTGCVFNNFWMLREEEQRGNNGLCTSSPERNLS